MIDLDPDLWLCARLALGRGQRRAGVLLAWTTGTAVVAYNIFHFTHLNEPSPAGLLSPALGILFLGPGITTLRLFDLERGGLLDQTRLCGRPPMATLAAFVAGSAAPYVLSASVLIAVFLSTHAAAPPAVLAVLVLLGSLVVNLIAYGALPAAMVPDSRFARALLFGVTFVTVGVIGDLGWMDSRVIEWRELAALVTFAAALPAAVWLACRRLRRPFGGSAIGLRLPGLALVRLRLPRTGPPEFVRQLQSTVLSGGTFATIIAAPLAAYVIAKSGVDPVGTLAVGASLVPYGALLVGAFAASMAVRQEIEQRTLDLVRLTPQTPGRIAAGWYAAFAAPVWLAAALAVLAIAVARRAAMTADVAVPLTAAAVILPAAGMLEGFQRRASGSFVAVSMAAAMPLLFAYRMLLVEMHDWQTWIGPPRGLPMTAVATVSVTAAAIAASAGRIRRPHGPALAGAGAFAAAVVVAFCVRTPAFPNYTLPRIIVSLFVLVAPFAALEDRLLTPPWRRLSMPAAGAFVATAAVVASVGLTLVASAATGAAAALAVSVGILVHELLRRGPALSFVARMAVFAGVLRLPALAQIGTSPPAIQLADLAALSALLVALAIAHDRVRRK